MLPLVALNTVRQECFPCENGDDSALPQFCGDVSESHSSYGCGSSCGYDYTSRSASFRAPNFSVSLWEKYYDYGNNNVVHNDGVSSSLSPRSCGTSAAPMSGVYYDYYGDDCGYYNEGYGYGCGYEHHMPSGPEIGRTVGTSAITASEPNFNNHALVPEQAKTMTVKVALIVKKIGDVDVRKLITDLRGKFVK